MGEHDRYNKNHASSVAVLRRLEAILESQILTSYKATPGMPIISWVNTSGGVKRADPTNIRTNAYFLFSAKSTGETSPILVRNSTTRGSSKTIPKTKESETTKEVY